MTLPSLTAAPIDARFALEEPSLEVLSSPGRPEGEVLHLGFRVVVGREPGVTFRLDDPRLSRRHAEVRREGGGYVLLDLGSTNGTWVNGVRTARQGLRHGDSVRLGGSLFLFVDPRISAEERGRAELHAAVTCVDDNLRHLQQAFTVGGLTIEEVAEVVRDCTRAVRRLEAHAQPRAETPAEQTPLVPRVTSRSSHV